MALLEMFSGALECSLKSRCLEWLEQVIQGVNLKSFKRMLIVGRSENDSGQIRCRQSSQHVEAVYFRHLNVEKKQVGSMGDERGNRFTSAGAFGGDGDIRLLREQVSHAAT